MASKCKIIILVFIFSIWVNAQLHAQKTYQLEILPSTSSEQGIISKIKYSTKHLSKTDRTKQLNNAIIQLQAASFILAKIDSLIDKGSMQTAYISLNGAYKWKELKKGNLSELAIEEIGFQEKYFKGTNFNYEYLINIQQSIISFYENHGYPFASVALDSIIIDSTEISASLKMIQGPLIMVDTIIINGNSKINRKYIYQLLDIKPGEIYNEEKVKKINKQLATMQFAQESTPYSTAFKVDKATINIDLMKRNVNTFDGIIGFQPNSDNSNKLVLTGNLQLKLVNSFKRGESIKLNWQSPGGGSQNLDLDFAYPYLFNSPIGIAYYFQLYKQDTSFINIRNKPGISFIINGTNYIKISADLFSSSTLGSSILNNNILDMKSTIFEIEGNFNYLDYLFNPRKGWALKLSMGYGSKNIIKQHDINESYYDSIPLNTNQIQSKIHLQYFIPIFKRQTLLIANESALLQGDYLLSNEQYRIGGFNSLRGFDEQSIYASTYSVFTMEWRYLLETNSYVSLFWNGAYVENINGTNNSYDQPMGFGASLSFETNAGIFALSYAIGKQLGNPFQFSSSKIHFGYLARF